MPVAGPIAVLVLSRGLQGRFRSGANIAVGGALAEAVYACLAFWGFSTLLVEHGWIEPASRGAAALILLALGVHFTFHPPPPGDPTPTAPEGGLKRSFLLGFSIAALNPTLMATWSAAVTTLYSTTLVSFDAGHALPFALGAGAGIAGWFLVFLLLIRRFRSRFRVTTLDRVVRVTGLFLMGTGLVFAVRFVIYWS